jgi:hypothetical protein
MHQLTCPTCRQIISIPPEISGTVVTCPYCRYPFTVPAFITTPASTEVQSNLAFDSSEQSNTTNTYAIKRKIEKKKSSPGIVVISIGVFIGIVLALAFVGFLWNEFIHKPAVKNQEVIWSIQIDLAQESLNRSDKAKNDYEKLSALNTAQHHLNEAKSLENLYKAKYGRTPRYWAAKDR